MVPKRGVLLASIVSLSLLFVPVGTAGAQECTLDPAALQSLVDDYNEHVDRAPGLVRSQFAGERIDVRLETPDGDRRFALTTTTDGRITAFEEGVADDPTLRVETTESTFCEVVGADDHSAAFVDAYEGGEIDVSGVGTVNAVKVEVVKVGAGIVRVFSGLF